MVLTPPSSDEAPHIDALQRAVEAGFRFRQLADDGAGVPAALHAERWSRDGAVETITMQGMTEAIAARLRGDDYPHGDPVWQLAGTVAEVTPNSSRFPRMVRPARRRSPGARPARCGCLVTPDARGCGRE